MKGRPFKCRDEAQAYFQECVLLANQPGGPTYVSMQCNERGTWYVNCEFVLDAEPLSFEAELLRTGWRLKTFPGGHLAWSRPSYYVPHCHTHVRLIAVSANEQGEPVSWMLEICQTGDEGFDEPSWGAAIRFPVSTIQHVNHVLRMLDVLEEAAACRAS